MVRPKLQKYGINIPVLPMEKIRPDLLKQALKGIKGPVNIFARAASKNNVVNYTNVNQILEIIRDKILITKNYVQKRQRIENMDAQNEYDYLDKERRTNRNLQSESETTMDSGRMDPSGNMQYESVLANHGIDTTRHRQQAPNQSVSHGPMMNTYAGGDDSDMDGTEMNFVKRTEEEGRGDAYYDDLVHNIMSNEIFEPGDNERTNLAPGRTGNDLKSHKRNGEWYV